MYNLMLIDRHNIEQDFFQIWLGIIWTTQAYTEGKGVAAVSFMSKTLF